MGYAHNSTSFGVQSLEQRRYRKVSIFSNAAAVIMCVKVESMIKVGMVNIIQLFLVGVRIMMKTVLVYAKSAIQDAP